MNKFIESVKKMRIIKRRKFEKEVIKILGKNLKDGKYRITKRKGFYN